MKGTTRNKKIGRLSEITVQESELFVEFLERNGKARTSNLSPLERQENDDRLKAIRTARERLSLERQEILDAVDADDKSRKRRYARMQVASKVARWVLTIVTGIILVLMFIG